MRTINLLSRKASDIHPRKQARRLAKGKRTKGMPDTKSGDK